jgi:DNA-binding GntR family transcriptional regulator
MNGLLEGFWKPGDTLSTYALSQEMDISRSPIIEALKRLESEGIVEILPQVGCRVVRPSAAAIRELYALRGAVEGLAAQGAAERVSDRELRNLRLMLTRMDAAIAQGDPTKFEVLNYQFHTRVTHASRMPRVEHVIAGLWSQLRFQLAQLPFSIEEMTISASEHKTLFEALRHREAEQARLAAERHALQSGARLRERMATAGESLDERVAAGEERLT